MLHNFGIDTEEFKGNYTVDLEKRSTRANIQIEAMRVGSKITEHPELYYEFSERMLDLYLKDISVTHIESGTVISTRNELEYIQAESLITAICGSICSGKTLGKQIV